MDPIKAHHHRWFQKEMQKRSSFGKILMHNKDEGVSLDQDGNRNGDVIRFGYEEHEDYYGYSLYDLRGKWVTHARSLDGLEYHIQYGTGISERLGFVSIIEEGKHLAKKKEKSRSR